MPLCSLGHAAHASHLLRWSKSPTVGSNVFGDVPLSYLEAGVQNIGCPSLTLPGRDLEHFHAFYCLTV